MRPDLQERMIAAAPPMTAAMTSDELGRLETSLTVNDKNRLLDNLEAKVQALIDEKELDLENIFSQTDSNASQTDPSIKAA